MNNNILIHNIETLCAKKEVNKTNALADCGAGKNFLSNLMHGSDPSIAKIEQIAKYFEVSIDYLLGRTDTPAMENSGMTADEQALLANYRQLNADGKKKANEYIVDLVKGGVYSDTVTKDIAAFGGADTITVSQEQLDEAIKKLLREQGLI